MHNFISFAVLGLVQGVTEFLPVSSTGHLILARAFFGYSPENGLAIDAVLQLATTLALVVYFWKDLMALARFSEKKLLMALIAGTVPAVILGIFLEHAMETAFRSAVLVAWTLIAGAIVMTVAEIVARRMKATTSLADVAPWKGFVIGLFQSLALVPGMSRSGMTISGGLFLGLPREAATRFGFLLAVPILAGSGAKKLVDLGLSGVLASIGPELLVGSLIAFLSGLAAIHFLLAFVRKYPLYVFVVYRVLLAALILAFL